MCTCDINLKRVWAFGFQCRNVIYLKILFVLAIIIYIFPWINNMFCFNSTRPAKSKMKIEICKFCNDFENDEWTSLFGKWNIFLTLWIWTPGWNVKWNRQRKSKCELLLSLYILWCELKLTLYREERKVQVKLSLYMILLALFH